MLVIAEKGKEFKQFFGYLKEKLLRRLQNYKIVYLKLYAYKVLAGNYINLNLSMRAMALDAPHTYSKTSRENFTRDCCEPLTAEQIRLKMHQNGGFSAPIESIPKFLKQSGRVFKRTCHSLKKEIRSYLDKRNRRLILRVSKPYLVRLLLTYVGKTGFYATPDNRYAWVKQGEVNAVEAVRLKYVNVMG